MHFLLLLYSLSDFTRLNLDLWHSVFLASRFARGVLKTFKCGAIFLLKKKKRYKIENNKLKEDDYKKKKKRSKKCLHFHCSLLDGYVYSCQSLTDVFCLNSHHSTACFQELQSMNIVPRLKLAEA